MSNEPETTSLSPEGRLEDAVALYFEAVDAGLAPDRREWLARYPDLAGRLEKFFADQQRMERFAEPLLPPSGPGSRPEFDDFEVLGELGRGGMSVVYKAREISLDRLVALKMIKDDFPDEQERERFRREARAVARLEHPHIVRVYQFVEPEVGRPYFVMELVEGSDLAKRLDHGPLPPWEAAELVEVLARAVHQAHRCGLVHRDLKPGNVLLTAAGTSKVSDHVKVADFGLAKYLDLQTSLAPSGAIVGTASYMAPEQARGQNKEVGPAADVYALGAILYECLTGRPPFQGASVLETLEQVLTREPVPPRQLKPRVPARLEAICLRCLRKAPAERYASGAELAAALHEYLEEAHEARWWSSIAPLLLLLATAHAGAHLAVFLLLRAGGPEWLLWLSIFAPYPLFFVALRANRDAPAVARQPRRLLWSIWVGQSLAGAAVFLGYRLTAGADYAAGFLLAYPGYAALQGLALFVMGSTYWSWEYALGLAWITLAALMPLALPYAPLAEAGFGAACYVIIGLHLRRLHLEATKSPRRDQR
jgi:serine/threonine-protein kinase